MIDDNDTRYLFNERQYAGNLVALTECAGRQRRPLGRGAGDDHLASGAKRSALGGEIGSLAPGRRADVVIWSGDPLQVSSNAEAVFIDGVQQPMDTRQTKLRERYRDLSRDVLPEAYRR